MNSFLAGLTGHVSSNPPMCSSTIITTTDITNNETTRTEIYNPCEHEGEPIKKKTTKTTVFESGPNQWPKIREEVVKVKIEHIVE